jgi:DNA-binding SARP family transcriptional activator
VAIRNLGEYQPSTLHLNLLGAPQVAVGERPVSFRTRKTLALLAYLALQRGQQPRERVADLFWPDADIDDARASLRTALTYLRHALGSDADAFFVASRESVGLPAFAAIDTDVQALADTQRLLRQVSDPGILRHQIENVAERYRGPFLEGLSLPDTPEFETWLEGQRTHWRGVAAELLDRLATLQVQGGDLDAAVTTLERWTVIDPDEESPWRRLIYLHLRRHDYAGARRTWKAYSGVLAELDVEPSPELSALAARVDGAVPVHEDAPEAGAAFFEPDCGSLPFVGRSNEWSSLLAAFERSRRGRPEVIVLQGEAGMGKTRLVSRFLATVKATGGDGVTGRALETVRELPYGAIVDALRTRLEAENAPDDLLSDLWLAELARLVPELRERYPDLSVAADDPALARGRLFEAVVRLGQALGDSKPLVLCIDDAQWTDAATRDLVRYAVRRWTEEGTPALLILSVRTENLEAEGDLIRWLEGLEHDVPTVWLTLDALERAHVAQLVERLVCGVTEASARFGTWLAARTGGNPRLLATSIRSLLQHKVLEVRPVSDGTWAIALPHGGFNEQMMNAALHLDARQTTRHAHRRPGIALVGAG